MLITIYHILLIILMIGSVLIGLFSIYYLYNQVYKGKMIPRKISDRIIKYCKYFVVYDLAVFILGLIIK